MSKVLIVDDSKTSRRILRTILEDNGHEVIGEASDGAAGVDQYMELKPDLVTLDITMPVLDGLSVLRKIKEYDSEAKVIMVTAAGQKSKMVESIKLGAANFIQKPFDDEQIINAVKWL